MAKVTAAQRDRVRTPPGHVPSHNMPSGSDVFFFWKKERVGDKSVPPAPEIKGQAEP